MKNGVRRDMIGLAILAVVSAGAGLGVNQLREQPLPLRHQSKAERMDNVVAKIITMPVPTSTIENTDGINSRNINTPPVERTPDHISAAATLPAGSNVSTKSETTNSPNKKTKQFAGHFSLEEFHAFVDGKLGLVLDARSEELYHQGHVPGALSLSQEDFENAYPKLKNKLEADKNQPLAVYCSGFDCDASTLVYEALIQLGYTHVAVFYGGWKKWKAASLPLETSP